MNILLVLIPVSLVFLLIAIGIFIWALRNKQFENLESAALDILASETEAGDETKNDGNKNDAG
ncbi:MAG TPA: cbb3-type cytochrome oxidase assembly protein CcoS [Arenimonas sp.]|nr:cbb3-type cytochrome oxidase assembly protein CcoS [Arenimonas sp.]HOZ06631.1 cbb3-type cytochrome oxidase assembly protein CcoS [Arenimonas sp.]HPO25336.1 cbb3-type cytochrome oxidase assembly protein CcoS [Arenimonas sp.]HPW32598.1 cbb3-type cytochrome oxidase assembly protein CcoS [Arenimonas sp.]